MTILVHPITQPSHAWQFTGQPLHEWPSWVQDTCRIRKGDDGRLELLHMRRSGAQVVYLEEWLVKDLDGEACFYTSDAMRREFEVRG